MLMLSRICPFGARTFPSRCSHASCVERAPCVRPCCTRASVIDCRAMLMLMRCSYLSLSRTRRGRRQSVEEEGPNNLAHIQHVHWHAKPFCTCETHAHIVQTRRHESRLPFLTRHRPEKGLHYLAASGNDSNRTTWRPRRVSNAGTYAFRALSHSCKPSPWHQFHNSFIGRRCFGSLSATAPW